MSWIAARYVVRTYLVAFAGILFGGLAIFLVADFVDRASAYHGPHWISDVALLYANKALVAVQLLGPGVLLLAAGTAVSLLKRRGELTALFSLTFGPNVLYLPIAACALGLSAGLIAFDEWVVVDAQRRVEELSVTRFSRWGKDWRFFFSNQQWFRRDNLIFYLREGDADSGFRGVTLFELGDDFTLARRIDANRLTYLGGTRWALDGVTERTFSQHEAIAVTQAPHREVDLATSDRPFRIRLGRPEQMRLSELRRQVTARREGGLPHTAFSLGLHNRFAYPLAGFPAALLAIGLSLRLGRRAELTSALVEGASIAVVMWGMMVVLKTLASAQHLSVPVAAWAPFFLLSAAAAWVRTRRELA